ncbi:hypothetical protein M1116_01440, partial [Patescibacteria group bacterium]|nr:hypothetical protein [Patescibacteria group bacterium]
MKTEKDRVAAIRLQGYPYHQEVDGKVIDCTDTLERLAQSSGYESRLQITIGQYGDCLRPLVEGGYYGIDAKLKKGEALTYEEAFSLMTFVSMGVNKKVHEQLSGVIKVGAMDQDTIFYQSIALLSAMSAKEAFAGLTPPEIAGMTAAALEIDTIVRVPGVGETYGIGGMGGDRGYPKNGENSKLFSLSTLGSLVLANEATVHKHHRN